MKKLIPAIVLLLISAIVMSTASYAWFSMNNKVTVTGMTITTKVNDNLFITGSTAGNDKSADSDFTNALHQSVKGQLQPVSTIDATNFFYTYDAAPDGHKISSPATNNYSTLTSNTININSTNYKGYVDYVFELKAINADNVSDKYLNLTGINLLYMGEATNVTKAFRVAVFTQQQADTSTLLAQTAVTDAYSAIGTTADKIFTASGAAYFNNTAVDSVSTKAAVTNLVNTSSGTGWSQTIPAGKTLFFKVTVRLWLEGEDTDCYNTKFVDLTKEWDLDLTFALENAATNAVKQIGSAAVAVANKATKTGTVALDGDGKIANGEKAASYQWYTEADGTAIASATAQSYANEANTAVKVYCMVTTDKGNVYRTNVISLDAA